MDETAGNGSPDIGEEAVIKVCRGPIVTLGEIVKKNLTACVFLVIRDSTSSSLARWRRVVRHTTRRGANS